MRKVMKSTSILILAASTGLVACGGVAAQGRSNVKSVSAGGRVSSGVGSTALSAAAIENQMFNAYKTATSYFDKGTVRQVLISDKIESSTANFTTAYKTADLFRLGFHEDASTTSDFKGLDVIIWQNGSDIKDWFKTNGPAKESADLSLLSALTKNGGVTHMVSSLVPELLLGLTNDDDHPGFPLRKLANLVRLPDAKTNGISCYRIQGTDHLVWPAATVAVDGYDREAGAADSTYTLWIDSTRDALLSIDEDTKSFKANGDLDYTALSTISYAPVINGLVTDDQLAYNKPPSN